MTNLFSLIDVLGWVGTAGLFAFYYLIARQRVLLAYLFGNVAGLFWLLVGILTPLPSLILMESVIILLNCYGIYNWRRKK